MQYKNINNNKIATYIKQINNDVHFKIDGIETILDLSKFNEVYEPYVFISGFEVEL